jgi:hypothetical protein
MYVAGGGIHRAAASTGQQEVLVLEYLERGMVEVLWVVGSIKRG